MTQLAPTLPFRLRPTPVAQPLIPINTTLVPTTNPRFKPRKTTSETQNPRNIQKSNKTKSFVRKQTGMIRHFCG